MLRCHRAEFGGVHAFRLSDAFDCGCRGHRSLFQHTFHMYRACILRSNTTTPFFRQRLAEDCSSYSLGLFDAVNGLHRNACAYRMGYESRAVTKKVRCTVIPETSHADFSRMQGDPAFDDSRCSREKERCVKQNRCWCCTSVIRK